MELSNELQPKLQKAVEKMLSRVPYLKGVTHVTDHLDALVSDVSRATALLKEAGYARTTSEVKTLTVIANNAISLKDGLRSRDADVEDVSDLRVQVRSSLESFIAKVKASKKADSGVVKDTEVEDAVMAAIQDAGDAKVLQDILRKKVKEKEEWDNIESEFKRNAKLASSVPKATPDVSFRLLRLPVVPIASSGYYNIEKLKKSSLRALDIDGRYFTLPNQLILAYNPKYQPSEDDPVENLRAERNEGIRQTRKAMRPTDLEATRQKAQETFEATVAENSAKVPKTIEREEKKAIKDGGKPWTAKHRKMRARELLVEIENAARIPRDHTFLAIDEALEKHKLARHSVPKYLKGDKETRFDLVLKGLESRLGEKLHIMEGVTKFRSSGFVFYWLLPETQVNTLRSAGVGSPIISEWGFPFK